MGNCQSKGSSRCGEQDPQEEERGIRETHPRAQGEAACCKRQAKVEGRKLPRNRRRVRCSRPGEFWVEEESEEEGEKEEEEKGEGHSR